MAESDHKQSIEATRDLFEEVVSGLGRPKRLPVGSTDPFWIKGAGLDTNEVHPVFGFAHHFRGNDHGNPGYTGNTSRGDHMSIPAVVDFDDLAVIDIGFHKGLTTFEAVYWPASDDPAHVSARRFAVSLLQAWETR